MMQRLHDINSGATADEAKKLEAKRDQVQRAVSMTLCAWRKVVGAERFPPASIISQPSIQITLSLPPTVLQAEQVHRHAAVVMSARRLVHC